MQTMTVTVPVGVMPGQQVQVQTPSGLMTVVVPPGAVPGGPLTISVPQGAPQQASYPQATPVQAMPVQAAPVQAMSSQPASGYMPPGQQPPAPQAMYPQPAIQQTTPSATGRDYVTPLLQSVPQPSDALQVPMGQPVSEAMPQIASASSLTDQYSGYTYTTEFPEEAGSHHTASYDANSGIADATAVPMGTPVFYTPEQLAILNRQPLPTDIFSASVKHGGPPTVGQPLPAVGLPVAESAAVAVARPVLTTAAGVPVVNTSVTGTSPARTTFDGWNGIKSCDVRLQKSVDELMLFFNTHNSRPLVGCEVEGWHQERRTRRRRVERNGKVHHETETYYVKVTDFKYKVDLTHLVFPFGYIASVDENHLSVPQLCEKFIRDGNLLKSLAMKKEVQFDFRALHAMVYGYIRSLGWRRGLTVSFPKANSSVRVYNENWLSQVWENQCCFCLCHATIVPCMLMRLYRGDCCCQEDHAEEDIRSYFRIDYAAIQARGPYPHPTHTHCMLSGSLWGSSPGSPAANATTCLAGI